MKIFRLILFAFVALLVSNNLIIPSAKAHDGFGEFPYEGTYLTEEDNAFLGYTFDADSQSITVHTQSTSNAASQDRYNRFRNEVLNNGPLSTMINPSLSAEEVSELREKWNLEELDYSNILLNVADQIEPWMKRSDALKLALEKVPGIYALSDISMSLDSEFLISQPEIQQSQNLWIVGLLGNPRILRFEMGESTENITDDYGVVYTLVEEGDQNE